MTTVISVEDLSKSYRLGQIGTGTFAYDLNIWWAKLRGKPNPMLRIGETDHGNRDDEEIWALDNVSFTVQQGEVLGIIGRNGAGKSTLLKILSRVTAPTSGIIKIKGELASLLEVGTGFSPELTGRENILLNGAIMGMQKNEVMRKFDEIVDFAEIDRFIDTPVKRYSSGMYVRLAFAVAAFLEPEILVVDEVLAVGDSAFQKKCIGKMGDVADRGRTVLIVSHNMGTIGALCSRAILLDRGKVQASGLTSEIITEYYNSFGNSETESTLSANVNRKGNGTMQFEKVTIQSHPNNSSSSPDIHVGDGLVITMLLEAYSNVVNGEANVGIFRPGGLRVSGLNSRQQNNWLFSMKKGQKVEITCSVPFQNLAPGKYYLNILVRDGNGQDADFIEQALTFEIFDSGFYKAGRPAGQVLVYLDVEWNLNTQFLETE